MMMWVIWRISLILRMTALGRGVVLTLATGSVTRVPCPHSATWKRCLASVIALEAIASGDSAEDAAEAISDYLACHRARV